MLLLLLLLVVLLPAFALEIALETRVVEIAYARPGLRGHWLVIATLADPCRTDKRKKGASSMCLKASRAEPEGLGMMGLAGVRSEGCLGDGAVLLGVRVFPALSGAPALLFC